MHLLNARTRQLEEVSHKPPAYAILSHRWRHGEVQFEDIRKDDACSLMPGYAKIKRCCAQAVQDGLEYVWVDTCCIDKQSSAVLSESLNSMFAWYKAARVCYAYLDDVSCDEVLDEENASFEDSEWFGRGWTLQELLAPETLYFFAEDWTMIGSKISLASTVARITGIHEDVLLYPERLYFFSIATRMSWAARRRTTKDEDMAYSLMGIFDVHMPIIYGEGGKKAFSRLQHEIIKASNDQSIFAWRTHIPGRRPPSTPLGPLAESPVSFSRSSGICRISPDEWTQYWGKKDEAHIQGTIPRLPEFTMTNNGLNITLPMRELEDPKDTVEAILCCCTGPVAWDGDGYTVDCEKAKPVCIYLKKLFSPHVQHYERTLDLDHKGEMEPRFDIGYVLKDIHLRSPQANMATPRKETSSPNFVVRYVRVSEAGFIPELNVAPRCVIAQSGEGTALLRMELPLEPDQRLTVARIVVHRPADGECFTVALGASSFKSGGGPWVYATAGESDERQVKEAVQNLSKMDWARLTLRTREVVNVTMRKTDSGSVGYGGNRGDNEYKVTLIVNTPTSREPRHTPKVKNVLMYTPT